MFARLPRYCQASSASSSPSGGRNWYPIHPSSAPLSPSCRGVVGHRVAPRARTSALRCASTPYQGSSRRLALIVQNDRANERLHNTVVAQITTHLSRASDSRHLCIDLSTAEGQQSGLLHDSGVSCTNLATVHEDRMGCVNGV